ncbi:hypothetical protein B0J17DRAFT_773410 [Rhizoctonia solani]|nr:hypothetical protein B0J17DRAFT_773410 [Rhizoctonia solani]
MAYPLYWLGRQSFHPIGNTPAVSLTQDLSPEQPVAEILLLGCGDPRSILFTIYSDLTVAGDERKFDITCCDIEPAVLARNILLFALLDQNKDVDRLWEIFYHFKIDDRALNIITRQSQELYECAQSAETWSQSRFGPFIKMVDTKTLGELRRSWKNWADYSNLHAARKAKILKTQVSYAKSQPQASALAAGPSRSAGMLWPQAMIPVSDLFRKYWETGTTFSRAEDIRSATNLNPTFLYSLSGEGFNTHYGMFPQGFHLISAYAPITSDPAGPIPSTDSPPINVSKQQFAAWCKASQNTRAADKIIMRFFAGDALALCHALYILQVTENPSTNIFAGAYRTNQIHLGEHVSTDGPTSFHVIDTSNLADTISILNLLIATEGLLKEQHSVLYTETLIPSGQDATKSFPDRFCTDVPTIAMLLGLTPPSQYHERVTWSSPSGGDKHASNTECTVSFDAVTMARVLYGVYDKMFANEKLSNLMASRSPAGILEMSNVHFLRETVAMLFRAVQRRVHITDGNWITVVGIFFQMSMADGERIIESNSYQDNYLQFHLYGLFTGMPLKPNWFTNPTIRVTPRLPLFDEWKVETIPPVVCVVLTAPRRSLQVLFASDPDKVRNPTLQACVRVEVSHDNTFSATHAIWGKCVTQPGSDRVVIEEGSRDTSDLVVSFWASSYALEHIGTKVYLFLKQTPVALQFNSKLGEHLNVFGTDIMDKAHVKVLPYRPTLEDEPPQGPPSEYNPPLPALSLNCTCQATITKSSSYFIDTLAVRFNVESPEEKDELLAGAIVSTRQISPCTLQLQVGAHMHLITYPYPVDGTLNKLRIARKSQYVEVIVPVSTPTDSAGYFFDPFPIIQKGAYTPWNVHHLNLDRLPVLGVSTPSKIDWLNPLCALQCSEREKAIRNGPETQQRFEVNALVNVKDTIHAITMNYSGLQGYKTRAMGLSDDVTGDGIYAILLVGGIRLDTASFTIAIDAAVVPLSRLRMPQMMTAVENLHKARNLVKINTIGHEVTAWKRLMPAFVERCRNWSHKLKCEYIKKEQIPLSTAMDLNPICTCGQGIGFGTPEWEVPEWKDLLPFATRAALCPIFSLPYIERVAGSLMESSNGGAAKPIGVCWACNGPGKPNLSACGRCKQARYCSVECQRQHWKAHKKDCTTG